MRILLAFGALSVLIGSAEAAPGFCGAHQNDKAERPAPPTLLPLMAQTFGIAKKALRDGSFVRCAEGQLMGCIVGANLNCGHANVSRASRGGDAFCLSSPGADVVPLAATGHDTIYQWRCEGTKAVAVRALARVDRLGFTAANWRPVR